MRVVFLFFRGCCVGVYTVEVGPEPDLVSEGVVCTGFSGSLLER